MNPTRKDYEVRNGSHIAFMMTLLACELMLLVTVLSGCAAAPGPHSFPPGDYVQNLAATAAPNAAAPAS